MLETDSASTHSQRTGRDVLASLRQGTRAAHIELESHPSLLRLTQTADIAVYKLFLQSLHRLCLSVSRSAPRYFGSEDFRWLDYAGWIEALELDTRDLGASLEEHSALSLPLPSSPARFWGRLYVIEGSTLGGKVLARELSRQASLPVRFLERGARDSPQRWPYVLRRLTQFGEDCPEQEQELITAAQDTFNWMGDVLNAASPFPVGQRT